MHGNNRCLFSDLHKLHKGQNIDFLMLNLMFTLQSLLTSPRHSSTANVVLSHLKLFSLSHSVRHTTFGRTLLDEGSARRRDLYLATHNTHKRQISIPKARFEPSIPASNRPQTLTFRPIGHSDQLPMIQEELIFAWIIATKFEITQFQTAVLNQWLHVIVPWPVV